MYGVSRLKRAYKSWYIKDIILKAWGLTCQRYGTPYTIGKTKGTGTLNVNGSTVNAIDHLMNVLDSFGQTGSAVIGLEDVVEIKYAGTGYGRDFEALVAYCNKMIYRALGLPSLIADNGDTGSYALGKQHYTLFVQLMTDMLFEVIDTVVEHLIRPLVTLNFGEQNEGYGTFCIESYDTEDAKVIAETANILAQTGLSNMDDIDEVNYWRERLGMPLKTHEEAGISAPPEIDGYEPASMPKQSVVSETGAKIDAEIVGEIEDRQQRGKSYSYSHRARLAAQREMRLRVCSQQTDRLAEQLARFSLRA